MVVALLVLVGLLVEVTLFSLLLAFFLLVVSIFTLLLGFLLVFLVSFRLLNGFLLFLALFFFLVLGAALLLLLKFIIIIDIVFLLIVLLRDGQDLVDDDGLLVTRLSLLFFAFFSIAHLLIRLNFAFGVFLVHGGICNLGGLERLEESVFGLVLLSTDGLRLICSPVDGIDGLDVGHLGVLVAAAEPIQAVRTRCSNSYTCLIWLLLLVVVWLLTRLHLLFIALDGESV